MSEKNQTPKSDGTEKSESTDGSVKNLQAAFDEANKKGYFGVVPDGEDHTFAAQAKKLKK